MWHLLAKFLIFFQVFEFVKLTELYYAGSHGMDIVTSAAAHATEKVRHCRRTEAF